MSTASEIAGAWVKVRVLPLTEYAVVGICTTPLIMTKVAAVVLERSSTKTKVLPSPLTNCAVTLPVRLSHSVPS